MTEIFNALTVITITILLLLLIVINLYIELSENFRFFNDTYYRNKALRQISLKILMGVVFLSYIWLLIKYTPSIFNFIVSQFKVIF